MLTFSKEQKKFINTVMQPLFITTSEYIEKQINTLGNAVPEKTAVDIFTDVNDLRASEYCKNYMPSKIENALKHNYARTTKLAYIVFATHVEAVVEEHKEPVKFVSWYYGKMQKIGKAFGKDWGTLLYQNGQISCVYKAADAAVKNLPYITITGNWDGINGLGANNYMANGNPEFNISFNQYLISAWPISMLLDKALMDDYLRQIGRI